MTIKSSHPDIPSVLQHIVATKHEEVAAAKQQTSLEAIKDQAKNVTEPRRGFASALRSANLGIIAEIKKASPSKGIINHNFDPTAFAKQYETAGAACLSVLTDREYFQGADEYLVAARAACQLPVLRKDFMVDDYQIYQSFILGADCILLIMACLDDDTAKRLHEVSTSLGMDVLIEIHTQEELERALLLPKSEHNIYGVNNRNLNTFEVDLQTTLDLKQNLLANLAADDNQKPLIVTESGIHSAADIRLMLDSNISLFLIGEQFMKTDNPGGALQSLLESVAAQA